jgi:hypothetical protein
MKKFLGIFFFLAMLTLLIFGAGCTRIVTEDGELPHETNQELIETLKEAREKIEAAQLMFVQKETEEEPAAEEDDEATSTEGETAEPETFPDPQGEEDPLDTNNATTTNVPGVPFPVQ